MRAKVNKALVIGLGRKNQRVTSDREGRTRKLHAEVLVRDISMSGSSIEAKHGCTLYTNQSVRRCVSSMVFRMRSMSLDHLDKPR